MADGTQIKHGGEICYCNDIPFNLHRKFRQLKIDDQNYGELLPSLSSLRPRFPWRGIYLQQQLQDVESSHLLVCDESSKNRTWHNNPLITSIHPQPEQSAFNKVLLKLVEQEENIELIEINEKIKQFVRAKIDSACHDLAERYPKKFGGCVVHTVGSVGEGTKVGVYDEFDFMVELPALVPVFSKESHISDSLKVVSGGLVRRSSPYSDLTKELYDKLLPSLTEDWKIYTHQRTSRRQTHVLTLRYTLPDNQHVIISCDIVFFARVTLTSLTSSTSRQTEGCCRTTCKSCGRNLEQESIYLITDGGCYKSNVFNERKKLVNAKTSKFALLIYKLVKILIRDFVPPFADNSRIQLVGLIPSYWLKQLVIYMMCEFPEPNTWQGEYVALRVTQVLLWLKICLEEKTITNFFFPWINNYEKLSQHSAVTKKYIDMLVGYIMAAEQGDKSAVVFLNELRTVTISFKNTVRKEITLNGFCYVLHFYDIDEKNETHPNIITPWDYVDMYLKGVVEIRQERKTLYVIYNNKKYTHIEFLVWNEGKEESWMNDWSLDEEFPDRWQKCYDSLLEEKGLRFA